MNSGRRRRRDFHLKTNRLIVISYWFCATWFTHLLDSTLSIGERGTREETVNRPLIMGISCGSAVGFRRENYITEQWTRVNSLTVTLGDGARSARLFLTNRFPLAKLKIAQSSLTPRRWLQTATTCTATEPRQSDAECNTIVSVEINKCASKINVKKIFFHFSLPKAAERTLEDLSGVIYLEEFFGVFSPFFRWRRS